MCWQPYNTKLSVYSMSFFSLFGCLGTLHHLHAPACLSLLLWKKHCKSGWRSHRESEDFGWSWSWIPKNTKRWCRSRIFLSNPNSGSTIEPVFIITLQLVAVEMVQFLLKLLWKQWYLALHHDFHWLLVATKLLTAKLHSHYVKESEILER